MARIGCFVTALQSRVRLELSTCGIESVADISFDGRLAWDVASGNLQRQIDCSLSDAMTEEGRYHAFVPVSIGEVRSWLQAGCRSADSLRIVRVDTADRYQGVEFEPTMIEALRSSCRARTIRR